MEALRIEHPATEFPKAHSPVMLEEVLSCLLGDRHGVYIDATFGRGGHLIPLLGLLADDAVVVAVDRDPEAIESANHLAQRDSRVRVVQGCYSNLFDLARSVGVSVADGILMDIGVSSPQLDSPERGFSFLRDGPLDMRMDPTRGISAADWLNAGDGEEIERVIRTFGEEIHARAITRSILSLRPITRTRELRELVEQTVCIPDHRKHAATRVFQAIRIHVNNELKELDAGLDSAYELLRVGGRLAVLSFHSLEHRIVRSRFRNWVRPEWPHKLPLQGLPKGKAEHVEKGRRPSHTEIFENHRARSALLQVIERVEEK